MLLFRFCPPGLFHNARVAALCCVAGMVLSLSTLFAHEGHDDDATRSALEEERLPFRRRSLRLIVSDFLFPHDPDTLVSMLARDCARGAAVCAARFNATKRPGSRPVGVSRQNPRAAR